MYDNNNSEIKLKTSQLVNSRNIAELLDEEELAHIGNTIIEDFNRDKESRSEWEDRTEQALKLALQVVEEKTFPWPDASNVKFPLLTIASLQFHSRAYPALISSNEVVKCRVYGPDEDGRKSARAKRISNHMSYQILEEDENWEDQMDKVLITLPIIGCAFKKTYYSSLKGHNVSENILAKDLVVPYFTKSLETAQRISHVIYLTKNDIYEKVVDGLYLDLEDAPPPAIIGSDTLQSAQDDAQGMNRPSTYQDAPFEFIEQHCFWDLDGDGYAEPYIVIVRRDTRQVYRIVARYFEDSVSRDKKGTILHIKAENYFTKYSFIPSPDGGFYDLGFGTLLGPLNESVNTLINQLIDAGTMANTGGGFLGRGVRVKGGDYTFKPLEWKRVDSTGDDLRKNIVPLTVREPSQVLFTLLSLLINYGERIAGATDIMTGNLPGDNVKTGAMDKAIMQGMKIFNGIFKRTYRSLKEEFRKLYRLNQLYFNGSVEIELALKEDYNGPKEDVRPSADPNVAGDEQRQMQAQILSQRAMAVPGYNRYEVEKRLLEAFHVSDVNVVFPDPKGPNAVPPMPNPKVQIEQMKAQVKQMDLQIKMRTGILKLMQEAELNKAKIDRLEAEAIKALAEAKGVDVGHQIALLQTQIGAAKAHQQGIMEAVKLLQEMSMQQGENESGERSRLQGMEPAPSNENFAGFAG